MAWLSDRARLGDAYTADFTVVRAPPRGGGRPLSPLYQGPDRRAALLLGYASIGPSRIREGVRRLRDALRGVPTSRG